MSHEQQPIYPISSLVYHRKHKHNSIQTPLAMHVNVQKWHQQLDDGPDQKGELGTPQIGPSRNSHARAKTPS